MAQRLFRSLTAWIEKPRLRSAPEDCHPRCCGPMPHFVVGRGLIETGTFPFADLVSHTIGLDRLADGIATK